LIFPDSITIPSFKLLGIHVWTGVERNRNEKVKSRFFKKAWNLQRSVPDIPFNQKRFQAKQAREKPFIE
jgi:hypothetical protein